MFTASRIGAHVRNLIAKAPSATMPTTASDIFKNVRVDDYPLFNPNIDRFTVTLDDAVLHDERSVFEVTIVKLQGE